MDKDKDQDKDKDKNKDKDKDKDRDKDKDSDRDDVSKSLKMRKEGHALKRVGGATPVSIARLAERRFTIPGNAKIGPCP